MKCLTAAQVARRLECSESYARRLMAGKVRGFPPLPGVLRLHRWLVEKKAFKRWLARLKHSQAQIRGCSHSAGRNGHGA